MPAGRAGGNFIAILFEHAPSWIERSSALLLQAACGQITGLGGVDSACKVRIVEGGREDADFAPGVGYFPGLPRRAAAGVRVNVSRRVGAVLSRCASACCKASLQRGVQRLFLFCQQAGLGAQQQRQPFVRLQCCAVLLQELLGLPGDVDRVRSDRGVPVRKRRWHGQRQHQVSHSSGRIVVCIC